MDFETESLARASGPLPTIVLDVTLTCGGTSEIKKRI